MAATTQAVEVGDQFATDGRTVEVTKVIGLTKSANRHITQMRATNPASDELDAHIERVRQRRTYFYVKTTAHARNKQSIGQVTRVSERSLLHSGRYQRVSKA